MDATTTQRNMQSDQQAPWPRLRCWVLVSGPAVLRPLEAWERARGHYLLRLTGRLSLVCVCFFLRQPVRLYWWWPRLPTGGRTPPLPTEL